MFPFSTLEEAFKLYVDSTPDHDLKTKEQLTAARYDFFAGCAAMSHLIVEGDQAHNLDEVFHNMQQEIAAHSNEAMAVHLSSRGQLDA